MKKTYIKPEILFVVAIEEELPLCASGVFGSGIGYGGVDSYGDHDPSSKMRGRGSDYSDEIDDLCDLW